MFLFCCIFNLKMCKTVKVKKIERETWGKMRVTELIHAPFKFLIVTIVWQNSNLLKHSENTELISNTVSNELIASYFSSVYFWSVIPPKYLIKFDVNANGCVYAYICISFAITKLSSNDKGWTYKKLGKGTIKQY